MAEIDEEVDQDLDPRDAVRLLRSIPGVSDLTAQVGARSAAILYGKEPGSGLVWTAS